MDHIRLMLCCVCVSLLAACGGGGGSSAPPVIVTVTPAMASVMVGQQIQLTATTTNATGPVTWSSSNAVVATVNSTGLVMALTLGQATITATSGGVSGTAALTTTTGIVFATVSAGGNHTCGLTPAGVAYCWGNNSSGQLGNGTTTNSAAPAPVSGALTFAIISAGGSHTCGLTLAGVAYCWGDNTYGQLGNGTTISSVIPVSVSGGLYFATQVFGPMPNLGFTLSAGGRHTCGISAYMGSVAVSCWGNNSSGQLGNGTMASSPVPVSQPGIPYAWSVVSAGSSHTCATTYSSGSGVVTFSYCWGNNSAGQLGNGSTTDSTTPVQFAIGGATTNVMSAGTLYTCGAPFGQASSCWGNNSEGQLGNGTTVNSATPIAIAGGLAFEAASAGGDHACGLVITLNTSPATGVPYCWGGNSSGQLGNGATTNSPTPVAVSGGLNFGSVSAGGSHTCGVILNSSISPNVGAVYCWGDNTYGQLGNSWTMSSSVPVNVAGSP